MENFGKSLGLNFIHKLLWTNQFNSILNNDDWTQILKLKLNCVFHYCGFNLVSKLRRLLWILRWNKNAVFAVSWLDGERKFVDSWIILQSTSANVECLNLRINLRIISQLSDWILIFYKALCKYNSWIIHKRIRQQKKLRCQREKIQIIKKSQKHHG